MYPRTKGEFKSLGVERLDKNRKTPGSCYFRAEICGFSSLVTITVRSGGTLRHGAQEIDYIERDITRIRPENKEKLASH